MDIEYFDGNFNTSDSSFFSYVENRDVKYKTNSKVQLEDKVSIFVINELLNRYSFIYENAGVILGQLIHESNLLNLSIGNSLSKNTNIYLNEYNCPLQKECKLFSLLEEFLLGDIPVENTSFYAVIKSINEDENLFKRTKIQFVNEDVKDFNMRVILEFVSFMIEHQKGAYVTTRASDGNYERVYDHAGFVKTISISDIKQKLKALRPYFDIVFYQNRENGMWNGKRRIWADRRDEFEVNFTLVDFNYFNKCFSDTTYQGDIYLENFYRLPEDTIQSIYTKYHDELPWNMKVKCFSDNSCVRPRNTSSCGSEFLVKEEDMFVIDDNVYHLCSNCGYIVRVSVNHRIKNRIKRRCSEDNNYLRKKEIMSELMGLNGVDKAKVLVIDK